MKWLLFLCFCLPLHALPVGNPADAGLLYDGICIKGYEWDPCDASLPIDEALSLRFGYYGDFVSNRHLEVDRRRQTDVVETNELVTNALFWALNGWEKIDLFGTLGATRIELETNASSFGIPTSARFALRTNSSFSWSVGLRGTVWECGCTCLGAEAQYFWTKPHINQVELAGATRFYPRGDVDLKYREWQFGFGLSHRFILPSGFTLSPYIALKWSRVLANADRALLPLGMQTAEIYNLTNTRSWGYAVGASLLDCFKMSVTIEGRFADERAFYLNGQIRF